MRVADAPSPSTTCRHQLWPAPGVMLITSSSFLRRVAERPVPPLPNLSMRGIGRRIRKVGKSTSRLNIIPPRLYLRPVRPRGGGAGLGLPASRGVYLASGRRPDTCQPGGQHRASASCPADLNRMARCSLTDASAASISANSHAARVASDVNGDSLRGSVGARPIPGKAVRASCEHARRRKARPCPLPREIVLDRDSPYASPASMHSWMG
jgi:hypothetical protein